MRSLVVLALVAGCGVSAAAAPVPQVVGKGLAVADDELSAAGFRRIRAIDVSGRGRIVLLRRDWQVCGQHAEAAEIRLDVVKVGEVCPGAVAEPAAPGLMPDFTGESVRVAKDSLPPRTSIKIQDATGSNRLTLMDTAWRICRQTPPAGERLQGRPVQLWVVKYGERCPSPPARASR
ncbi:PASTA domain-containing protein [Nonomuraea sp. NPDC050536]|uniref:PASTA domain-containing protein n=1 Tax=Nonomuraea sp. NPDC050536 TaxID=3364366 RepID=UPI0037C9A376